MNTEPDFSGDFEAIVDWLETATLKIGDEADVTLTDCVLSEPYRFRELDPTGAQVIRAGTVFVWPVSKSDQPPVGSVIVDSEGTYWTALKTAYKQHVETWEAMCLNLGIVTADANEATLLKATYGKGDANESLATWVGLVSESAPPTASDTVAARFQPSAEDAKLRYGSEYTDTIYRVFLEAPVPMEIAGGEYRLVDSAGYRYRVLKYFNECRIDKLPVILAERILEGTEYHDETIIAEEATATSHQEPPL